MEVNKVNGAAFLPLVPVADGKLHADPEVTQAVQAINGAKLFGQDSELSFLMDRETKQFVVRLVDKDTGKVIRQIPTEEILRRAASLKNK